MSKEVQVEGAGRIGGDGMSRLILRVRMRKRG